MPLRPPAPLLAALLTLHSSLFAAQAAPPAWRLDGGPISVTVREVATRGYAALPVSTLVGLGAEVAYDGTGVVARFGAGDVRFTPGSAEVELGGRTLTLDHPVYSEGGSAYVPTEFFTRWLGEASGGALVVAPAERTIRRVAVAAPASPDTATTGARAAADQAPRADASPTRPEASAEQPRRPLAVQAAERPSVRRLVVVDAGHGGRDPGAQGPNGTREKDVTLRVARRVAALLRADPTLDVRMTRDRDTLIALHDRSRFANRWRSEGQPAVFISIHCNANASRSEKGYETYFLSEARTADARRVENFENASVQYEEHATGGDPLGFILTDLRQNHYLRESSEWAQMIQDGLRSVHPGPNRGVKQAGFAVLRGTFMPAVLVEIGFISNLREERMLNDEEMEEAIARRLAESVRGYFDGAEVRPASE